MNTNALELVMESNELTDSDLEQVAAGNRAKVVLLAAEFVGAVAGAVAHRVYHWIVD